MTLARFLLLGQEMTLTRLGSLIRWTVLILGLLVSSVRDSSAQVSVPWTFPTIQSAINAVLSGGVADGTTIEVQPGTYFEALSIANTSRSVTVRAAGGGVIVDASGKARPPSACPLPPARLSSRA
jgi:pectin methylesterase-like acyl-CoA thioesterase